MGEKPIVQVSNLLRYGMKIDSIKNVRGTAYIEKDISSLKDYIEIPSFEEVSTNKKILCRSLQNTIL